MRLSLREKGGVGWRWSRIWIPLEAIRAMSVQFLLYGRAGLAFRALPAPSLAVVQRQQVREALRGLENEREEEEEDDEERTFLALSAELAEL